jgi:predicted Zn-dependent protease
VVVNNTLSAGVNGYGRSQETGADALGLDLMVAAGYDPNEAPKVFEIFARLGQDPDSVTHFFHGTHPMNRWRADMLRQLVAERHADTAGRGVVDTQEFQRIRMRMYSA